MFLTGVHFLLCFIQIHLKTIMYVCLDIADQWDAQRLKYNTATKHGQMDSSIPATTWGRRCISHGMNILRTWESSLISCEHSCKCYERHNQQKPFCSVYEHGCFSITPVAFLLWEKSTVNWVIWNCAFLLHNSTLSSTLATISYNKMKNRNVGGCGTIHWGLELGLLLTKVISVTWVRNMDLFVSREFLCVRKHERGHFERDSHRCYHWLLSEVMLSTNVGQYLPIEAIL
jgi:hypothetical protein